MQIKLGGLKPPEVAHHECKPQSHGLGEPQGTVSSWRGASPSFFYSCQLT